MNLGYNPLSRKDNIVIQEINGEVLIYDLAKNKALCLNETSAMVWHLCDGKTSVAEMSRILTKKVKENVSEDIIWLAVHQFQKDDLIEKSKQINTPFEGMNRREIVKRIGFASMIALPIISSIIAPAAINAASTICGCNGNNNSFSSDGGCPCNSNNDCCTNVCGGGGTTCTSGPTFGGASSCCVAIICPPANGTNVPPGCGCNGNGNCATNICTNGICHV
ncbi:MAG: PqqD family protein [Pyrinomonadaceae bacterium]|nr:PqqD family protein [Pyrinomonadaceae bacterium]